jgi:16S rRNA processing protein RimM
MSSSSTDQVMSGPSAGPTSGAGAFLEIGRIEKPHGVRGDVIVRLTTNRVERLAPGTVLHTSRGTLEVVASKPHHDRYLVTFSGIVGREGADELRGFPLWALPLDDPDELWVHDLIGAEVVDAGGVRRGRVVEVLANPASDLLELDTGALVPVRFVTGVVPRERVDVDVPDGLFELA